MKVTIYGPYGPSTVGNGILVSDTKYPWNANISCLLDCFKDMSSNFGDIPTKCIHLHKVKSNSVEVIYKILISKKYRNSFGSWNHGKLVSIRRY